MSYSPLDDNLKLRTFPRLTGLLYPEGLKPLPPSAMTALQRGNPCLRAGEVPPWREK